VCNGDFFFFSNPVPSPKLVSVENNKSIVFNLGEYNITVSHNRLMSEYGNSLTF